jgi:hypothetical protein
MAARAEALSVTGEQPRVLKSTNFQKHAPLPVSLDNQDWKHQAKT